MATDQGIFEEVEFPEGFDAVEGIIISVVESRAREVCLARMTRRAEMDVYVFADSHSYVETLMTLQTIRPTEVLLPDSSRGSVLAKKIEAELTQSRQKYKYNARVVYISRLYYDQDRGLSMLSSIVVGNMDADLASKYIVLAGCYCLIRYVENITGATFAAHSLRLQFHSGTSDRVSIDTRTAASLELICSLRDSNQRDSLFGVLNGTCTLAGERMLRANILRPLYEISTLRMRHSLVALLVGNARVSHECTELLRSLPDLDFMLDGLCKVHTKLSDRVVVRSIDTILMLRKVLEITTRLSVAIMNLEKGADESDGKALACAISAALNPPSAAALISAVDLALDPHALYTKKTTDLRHAECFAIRTGVSGLLDLARSTYLASLEAMEEEAASFAERLAQPVRLVSSASRGYYLQLPSRKENLLGEFVQIVQGRKLLSCTTERIAALSQRAQEALNTSLHLTYDSLQAISQLARSYSEELFLLTDSSALLDMLLSFANVVASRPSSFVRPTLSTEPDAKLILLGAKNIVAANAMTARGVGISLDFVGNDLNINPSSNVVVVSGPNGSGKSIYIRQAALCVIMAQIGMFVPAQKAIIPLRDRIFARMGPSEDEEHNISAFHGEMKELAYLALNTTSHTLALVDELGRGTSHLDGVSLAFAAVEWLASQSAFTLFVTHYPQLSLLPQMYPNVRCIHMRTAGNSGLKFNFKIGDGPSSLVTGYGIQLARECGFPFDIVSKAETLQTSVKVCNPLLLSTLAPDIQLVAGVQLMQYLLLLGNSSWHGVSLRKALHILRQRVSSSLSKVLLQLLIQTETAQTPISPAIVSPQVDKPDKCDDALVCLTYSKKRAFMVISEENVET